MLVLCGIYARISSRLGRKRCTSGLVALWRSLAWVASFGCFCPIATVSLPDFRKNSVFFHWNKCKDFAIRLPLNRIPENAFKKMRRLYFGTEIRDSRAVRYAKCQNDSRTRARDACHSGCQIIPPPTKRKMKNRPIF